jgi:hypothetical protein
LRRTASSAGTLEECPGKRRRLVTSFTHAGNRPVTIFAMAPLKYLDAGSGSMLLQIILGGAAAVGVTAKLTWRRLLRALRIRRDDDDT